jgi:hypothetical protein
VERVTDALCAETAQQLFVEKRGDLDFPRLARAAIEAMREQPGGLTVHSDHDARDFWRAMAEAAPR